MNSSPYRLVALDLDGTVLPSGQPISERTRRVVAEVQSRGVPVILASGRMFSSAIIFARDLGLSTPLICYGGALIRHPETGDVLYHQGVPLALARQVVQAGREMGLPANVYIDDQIYVDALLPGSPSYDWLVRVKARAVGDLLSFLDRDPTHMALICDPAETKRRVLELRNRFGEQLHFTSGHPLLAEASHPTVSKGRALARLAEEMGVQREQVLAMGNDWNDVDMLAYAGLGVAMAGSPPEVLAVADRVAPPAAEDGAAAVLEEIFLGNVEARKSGR